MLEKRMYFFVPYNISPIQQAIQAGHAVEQYGHKYKDDPDYVDYVENWKTWIILNGGTTNNTANEDGCFLGSLNTYTDLLDIERVKTARFYEPDLNNALTAVCFICDERVFDYEKYPDLLNYILSIDFPDDTKEKYDSFRISGKDYEELKELFPGVYIQWEQSLGGKQNVFLRNLLKGKKLA